MAWRCDCFPSRGRKLGLTTGTSMLFINEVVCQGQMRTKIADDDINVTNNADEYIDGTCERTEW